MDPNNENAGILAGTLSGQKLHIPDLHPTFAAWKQSVNPLHAQARQAADIRLAGLIEDEKALAKTRAVDIALFASMYGYRFPSTPSYLESHCEDMTYKKIQRKYLT